MGKIKYFYLSFLSVAVFFIVWQMLVQFGIIGKFFIGSPVEIIREIKSAFIGGYIYPHIFSSLKILALGFFPALVLGVLGGFLIGMNKSAEAVLRPFVSSLNALPKVALIPLLIIWFGIGDFSKITIVFLMAIIPIMMNVSDGVKNTEKSLLKMAQSFKLNRVAYIKNVVFFSCLPFIFAGTRIAIGKAIIGLVVAEVFGQGIGLGYLVSYYATTLQTSRLMFIIILLVLIALLLEKGLGYFENKFRSRYQN